MTAPNNYPTFDDVNKSPNINNNNINNNNGDIGNIIANRIVESAGKDIKTSFLDRLNCNLSFLQKYFDIETEEIRDRLIFSLIPLNSKFITLVQNKPDLYGPFWIYTTLVFVIAASGSLTKYLHGIQAEEFFQEFVPLAASVIYGIGFCLPIILCLLMKFFGSETGFMLVLCIYAYSFTIFIPIMILCVPFESLQWILLAYGVISSTLFLLLNFQVELNNYVDNRKYFILGVIVIFQICLFLVLKLQFFSHISEKMNQ